MAAKIDSENQAGLGTSVGGIEGVAMKITIDG